MTLPPQADAVGAERPSHEILEPLALADAIASFEHNDYDESCGAGPLEIVVHMTTAERDLIALSLRSHADLTKQRDELMDLALEVEGCWSAFEQALRQDMGNTNYAIIRDKLEKLAPVLSRIGAGMP